jgi:archaellum biogenesis ATPase FlaH
MAQLNDPNHQIAVFPLANAAGGVPEGLDITAHQGNITSLIAYVKYRAEQLYQEKQADSTLDDKARQEHTEQYMKLMQETLKAMAGDPDAVDKIVVLAERFQREDQRKQQEYAGAPPAAAAAAGPFVPPQPFGAVDLRQVEEQQQQPITNPYYIAHNIAPRFDPANVPLPENIDATAGPNHGETVVFDGRLQKMADNIASDYCMARNYYDKQELEGALIFFMLAMRGLIDLSNFSTILLPPSDNAFLLTRSKNFGFCPQLPSDIQEAQRELSRYILPLQSELKRVKMDRLAGGSGQGGPRGGAGSDQDGGEVPCKDVRQVLSDNSLSFDDLIGQDEAKEQLKTSILYPLLYPRLFPVITKGILLYGPPGVGKTMIVQAFVNELQRQAQELSMRSSATTLQMRIILYAPKGGDLKDKYVGGTDKNITKWFKCAARRAGQCQEALSSSNAKAAAAETRVISVIFVDELEALVPSRELSENSVNSTAVATFLQEMEGVESNPNVIVIAATNYPWQIDSAVLRRFNAKVYVTVPTVDAAFTQLKTEIAKYIQRALAAPERHTTLDYKDDYDAMGKRRRSGKNKNSSALEKTGFAACTADNGFACGSARNDVCLKPWKRTNTSMEYVQIYTYFNKRYFPFFTDNELLKFAAILVTYKYSNSDIRNICNQVFKDMGVRALLRPYTIEHLIDPKTLITRPQKLREPCNADKEYDFYLCSANGIYPAVESGPRVRRLTLFSGKALFELPTTWTYAFAAHSPDISDKLEDAVSVFEQDLAFESVHLLTAICAKKLAPLDNRYELPYPKCMMTLQALSEHAYQIKLAEAMLRTDVCEKASRTDASRCTPSKIASLLNKAIISGISWIRGFVRGDDYSDRTFVSYQDLTQLVASSIEKPKGTVTISLSILLELPMISEQKAAMMTDGRVLAKLNWAYSDYYGSRTTSRLRHGLSYFRYFYYNRTSYDRQLCTDDFQTYLEEITLVNLETKQAVSISKAEFAAIDPGKISSLRATSGQADVKSALGELKLSILHVVCSPPLPPGGSAGAAAASLNVDATGQFIYNHLVSAVGEYIAQKPEQPPGPGDVPKSDQLIEYISDTIRGSTPAVCIKAVGISRGTQTNVLSIHKQELINKNNKYGYYDVEDSTEFYMLQRQQLGGESVYGTRKDPQNPAQFLLHRAVYLTIEPARFVGQVATLAKNVFDYRQFQKYDIEVRPHTIDTLTKQMHPTMLETGYLTVNDNRSALVPITGLTFTAGERSMTVCVDEGVRHRLVTLDFTMSDFEKALTLIRPIATAEMLAQFEAYKKTGEVPKKKD